MVTFRARFPAPFLTEEQQAAFRPLWDQQPPDVQRALRASTKRLARVDSGATLTPDAFESLIELASGRTSAVQPGTVRAGAEAEATRLSNIRFARETLRDSGGGWVDKALEPEWSAAETAIVQLGRAMRQADLANLPPAERAFAQDLLRRFLAGSVARGPQEISFPYTRQLSGNPLPLYFDFLHRHAPELLGVEAPRGARVTLEDSLRPDAAATFLLHPGE